MMIMSIRWLLILLSILLCVGCRQPRPSSILETRNSEFLANTRTAIAVVNVTTEQLIRETQTQAVLQSSATQPATLFTATPSPTSTSTSDETATALVMLLSRTPTRDETSSFADKKTPVEVSTLLPSYTVISAVEAAQLTATALASLFNTTLSAPIDAPTLILTPTPTWTPTLIGFPDTPTPMSSSTPTPTLDDDEIDLRLSATAFYAEYDIIQSTIGATDVLATSRAFQAQIPKISTASITPTIISLPDEISEAGILATANWIFQNDMELTAIKLTATSTPHMEKTIRAQLTAFMRQTEVGPPEHTYLVPMTFTPIPIATPVFIVTAIHNR